MTVNRIADYIAQDNVSLGADFGRDIRLNRIFEDVAQDAYNKRDIIVPAHSIMMGRNGRLYFPGVYSVDPGYELNDWSLGQLASRTGIPARYLRNCPPELQATNVNHWLAEKAKEESQSDWMLRVRQIDVNNTRRGGLVRGIMTERYSPFDDHEILEILNKMLGVRDGSITINWFHRDETGFHLRMTFEDLTTSLGTVLDGKDDIHKVGLHITNSEVGKRSIRITPLVWRQVCSNGLMGWAQEHAFVQRHVGLTYNEMFSRVGTAIGDALRAGDDMIKAVIASKEMPVEDPFDVIDKLAKDRKYSKEVHEKIKDQFMVEPSETIFGITQSLTRAARYFDADRRTEMEEDASNFLRRATKQVV